MKLFKTIAALGLSLILFNLNAQTSQKMETKSLFDTAINLKNIDGEAIDFNAFKGKFILFVNVASECGFTSQYEALQELHTQHKEALVIIGVPCNQFGNQEPGSAKEIKSFCSKNYGVEFLITEKIAVKGDNQHPLYAWLTLKEKNGAKSSTVKWNFQKYLLDRDGNLIDFFYSVTAPNSEKITQYLTH